MNPAAPKPAVPAKIGSQREEILQAAGELRAAIYDIVRSVLDDLDEVAPWSLLYCPPEDPDQLLALERALLLLIDTIPDRLAQLSDSNRYPTAADDQDEARLQGDIEFFFSGIHMSIQGDLDKLRSSLDRYQDSNVRSAQDADLTCEVAADLKGKYTSSLMGAAANLISGEDWSSIEIEPLLFPEKIEEFKRNRALVSTLSEVIDSISRFSENIDLEFLLDNWRRGLRVDRYALSSLYSFLGRIGHLLQEGTRRALYSGDFHQIQHREQLLNIRINELNLLHSSTWDQSRALQRANSSRLQTYSNMAQKLLELMAILDIDLLKKTIGEKAIKDLRLIVTLEKEEEKRLDPAATELEKAVATQRRREHPRLNSLPKLYHSLVPLLYEEDLKTFLELLLGSVLKRASLTLPEDHYATLEDSSAMPAITDAQAAAVQPPAPEPAAEEQPESPAPATETERLEILVKLKEALNLLSSRSSQRRKSFDMVHRLLRQKRALPPAMVQSMQPFLDELAGRLIPCLAEASRWFFEIPATTASDLQHHCRVLSDPEMRTRIDPRILESMDAIGGLLSGLTATADELLLRIRSTAQDNESDLLTVS